MARFVELSMDRGSVDLSGSRSTALVGYGDGNVSVENNDIIRFV